MPINPFQSTAEAAFGQYDVKKSGRIAQLNTSSSLSGQGHQSKAWNPGYTTGELSPTPQARGRMAEGSADIGRASYGRSKVEEPTPRESRRMAFGGMGAGATKSGGSTFHGNVVINTGAGNAAGGDQDFSGNRGVIGSGSQKDTNTGDVDQSQTYAPVLTGPRGGDARGGAGGDADGRGAGGGAGGRTTVTAGAGGNARGGDAGDMMTDMGKVTFGSPSLFNRNNRTVGRDDLSDNSKTSIDASRRTSTKSTDMRKAAPAAEKPGKTPPAGKKPAAEKEPASPEKAAPAGKKTPGKKTPPAGATPETKPEEKKPAATKPGTAEKVDETKKRESVKDKARKSMEAAASATKDKKTGTKTKKTRTKKAGKVVKEEEE